MGDRFFRFVAHVGKAESATSEFAVTTINHEMMFRPQLLH
jgi:hypothetical protein